MGVFVGAALDGRLARLGHRIRSLCNGPRVIGLLVAFVVVGSMVMVFLQGRDLDRQRAYLIRVTECQTKANEAFREALAARSTAGSGQRDAQIEQITRQIEQNQGQGQLLAITSLGVRPDSVVAISDYAVKLDANTAALQRVLFSLQQAKAAAVQNPYPPLKCGDL